MGDHQMIGVLQLYPFFCKLEKAPYLVGNNEKCGYDENDDNSI